MYLFLLWLLCRFSPCLWSSLTHPYLDTNSKWEWSPMKLPASGRGPDFHFQVAQSHRTKAHVIIMSKCHRQFWYIGFKILPNSLESGFPPNSGLISSHFHFLFFSAILCFLNEGFYFFLITFSQRILLFLAQNQK